MRHQRHRRSAVLVGIGIGIGIGIAMACGCGLSVTGADDNNSAIDAGSDALAAGDAGSINTMDTTSGADTGGPTVADEEDGGPITLPDGAAVQDTGTDAPVLGTTHLSLTQPQLPPSPINLTTEGTIDWKHWGHKTPVDVSSTQKQGGQSLGVVNANDGLYQTSGFPLAFTWSNGGGGYPTMTSTNTFIYVPNIAAQFTHTATASATTRIFTVYGGVSDGVAQLAARLTDDSAPPVQGTPITANVGGGYTAAKWVITYDTPTPNARVVITLSATQSFSPNTTVMIAASTVQ